MNWARPPPNYGAPPPNYTARPPANFDYQNNPPPRPPFPAGPPYQQSSPPMVTDRPPPGPKEFLLDDPTLSSFKVSRTFSENSAPVNHIDFSPQGDVAITSGDDDVIVAYDCVAGGVHKILNCKRYGVDNITYSHSPSAVFHSSTKLDDSIRYLNVPENKYISTFPGHTKKVLQLAVSPIADQFISSSQDKTIRIWDYRQRLGCVGVLNNLDTSPVIAFDPEGVVFAAGACVDHEHRIMLYDIRNPTEGPFNIFRYPEEKDSDWCIMKISPNGRYILICTNGIRVYVMDSFTGECCFILKGHANRGLALEASFTPDSNFVIIGSYDGKVHIWNLRTGRQTATLQAKQKEPIAHLQFAPLSMLMVTAGTKVSFWLPYA